MFEEDLHLFGAEFKVYALFINKPFATPIETKVLFNKKSEEILDGNDRDLAVLSDTISILVLKKDVVGLNSKSIFEIKGKKYKVGSFYHTDEHFLRIYLEEKK